METYFTLRSVTEDDQTVERTFDMNEEHDLSHMAEHLLKFLSASYPEITGLTITTEEDA
jgi:hypothetical protein